MNLRSWILPNVVMAARRARPVESISALPAPAPAKLDRPAARTIVMVSVLGLAGDALAGVVETTTAECAHTGTRPLFVTETDDFRVFRAHRQLFEQVVDPALCTTRRPCRDWHGYALQQYRLIGRKWQPVTTVAFGRQPDSDFLEAVLQGVRQPL